MSQPRSISPTTMARGTRTFSKNTSLNQATPVISTSGRIVIPGVFMSRSRNVRPLCLGAVGFDRTIRMHQSAKRA